MRTDRLKMLPITSFQAWALSPSVDVVRSIHCSVKEGMRQAMRENRDISTNPGRNMIDTSIRRCHMSDTF